MDSSGDKLKRILTVLGLPEVQIFWVLVPLLVAVLALSSFNPPISFSTKTAIIAALLVVIGAVVFAASYRLARNTFDTSVERNELREIIATITDALIVYDQSFHVLFFNTASERLFAVRAADVIGTEVRPQIAERQGFRLLAQVMFPSLAPTLIYRSKPGTYPQVVDLSFEDPLLELRVTTTTIIDEHGVTLGFMKLIANRTQEAALLRSKNDFIAVASHQLRTPITEVNWAIQTIASDARLDPGLKDLAQQTTVSARKILVIVEDLLNVTKIEEGHFGYELAPTNLTEFLEHVLGAAMPQVEHAGLQLYFERSPTNLPSVMIDEKKLSMVMANLIDNAVRYNVPNGKIFVEERPSDDGRFAEVSVRDTGIGIAAEEIRKTFSKFFRGTNAIKFQTDGSGLGLWIARNIIRAHGGDMRAESEVNRGTTFTFTLPTDPTIMPSKETANMPLGG